MESPVNTPSGNFDLSTSSMARTPYHDYNLRETPQSEALPGQVPNSAGGHAYPVDRWTRLHRFLILGTDGGSYYASEQALTKSNAKAVESCLNADAQRTINTIVEISEAGRNAKHQPVIFALAMAAGHPVPEVRALALKALPDVCRTGTHLFLFVSYIEQFRGWGRGLRNAVSEWYLNKDLDDLVIQVAKYRNREGWTHRDVLFLAKPQLNYPVSPEYDAVLRWAAGEHAKVNQDLLPDRAKGIDTVGRADNLHDVVTAIEWEHLPWEVVPSEWLGKPEVWHALLPNLPIGALVRNLGRLTANGTIKPMSGAAAHVVSTLTNEDKVRRSRIHPLNVLTAAVTYANGRGVKGSLSWDAIETISDALDKTFHLAFPNVEAANKRTLIALDVSGSMGWGNIAGTFLTPREAAAAMCVVTVATEPLVHVMAFAHEFRKVDITPRSTVRSVVRKTEQMAMGGTDCALPMLYALEKGLEVDTFVVYTDSETWFGHVHPVQALRKYRERTGIPARLIVVGMVANKFSIADPNDAGMLDVVGFDSATPALIANFSAGRV